MSYSVEYLCFVASGFAESTSDIKSSVQGQDEMVKVNIDHLVDNN